MYKRTFSIHGEDMTNKTMRDEMCDALEASGVKGEFKAYSEGPFSITIDNYTGTLSSVRVYARQTELNRSRVACELIRESVAPQGQTAKNYTLSYLKRGNVRLIMGQRELHLSPGSLFYTHAEIPVRSSFKEGAFEVIDLQTSYDALKNWIPSPAEKIGTVISNHTGWGRALASMFEELTPDYLDDPAHYYQAIPQICGVLSIAIAPSSDVMGEYRQGLYHRFLTAIRANFCLPDYSVKMLAEQYKLSEKTVYAVFAHAGTTFIQVLTETRLRQAVFLLSDPRFNSKSVSEIAYNVGFGNASYFSTVFRRKIGLSPQAFRKGRQG